MKSALSTNCPDCRTRFRITQEQLAVRQGLVRCGLCKTIFNGFASLQREEIPASQNSIDAVSPLSSSVEELLKGHIEQSAISLIWTPALDVNNEETTVSEIQTVDTKSLSLPSQDLVGYIDSRPKETNWMPYEFSDENSQAITSAPAQQTTDENIPTVTEPLPQTDVTGHRNIHLPEIATSETSHAVNPIQTEPFIYPPDVYEKTRPRFKSIALSLFLIMLLAGQAVFMKRTEIAAHWPELRPYLTFVCDYIGCHVPLPKQIDKLAIETSEMLPDPVRPNVVLVTAILRNHSDTLQSYPLLEVTLTDTQDRPIAKRSLQAQEYLPPSTKIENGLASNSEIVSNTAIEAIDLKPSGYRLRLYFN